MLVNFFHWQVIMNLVILFGVDNSTSGHAVYRKKDILIFGKAPTEGLDDTTITADT